MNGGEDSISVFAAADDNTIVWIDIGDDEPRRGRPVRLEEAEDIVSLGSPSGDSAAWIVKYGGKGDSFTESTVLDGGGEERGAVDLKMINSRVLA